MSETNPIDIFAGAKRHAEYGEDLNPQPRHVDPEPASEAVEADVIEDPAADEDLSAAKGQEPAPEAQGAPQEVVAVNRGPAQPGRSLDLLPESHEAARTRSSEPTGLARLFRRRRFPTATDMANKEAQEANIRQFTATRSNNVMVANTRSSGKTSTCLVLAGVLAEIRGGSVVITEATPAPGDLFARAEGQPRLGLSELLGRTGEIGSAGALAGFTAPQTSKAAVIGSGSPRDQLTPSQLLDVRRVLDTYYQLTVTDTGNNSLSETFTTAVATADAVVIPVVGSLASVRGAKNVQEAIERENPDLLRRVVVVMTHDGGAEDQAFLGQLPAALLTMFPEGVVLEVAYDPTIREDVKELSLGRLSEQSRHDWTDVASHVITALRDAPEQTPVTAQKAALSRKAPL